MGVRFTTTVTRMRGHWPNRAGRRVECHDLANTYWIEHSSRSCGVARGCRRKLAQELLYQQRLPISRNLFAYQQELFLLHFSFAYHQEWSSALSSAVTLLKHLSSAYHQVLSSAVTLFVCLSSGFYHQPISSRYTFRLPISRFLSSAYQQPLHLSLALFPTPPALESPCLYLPTQKLCRFRLYTSRAFIFAVARLSTLKTQLRRVRASWWNF